MKYFLFAISILISIDSFSQTKKELINEVKNFQQETYFNATYKASVYDIKLASSKYFKDYKIETQDSVSISFSKIEDLKAENTWEEAKHIVTVSISETNTLKHVALSGKTESYSKPFTPPTSNPHRGG